ncbi:hypothetical protein ElyMa_005530000 [Elysia marginata]|uniref:Uncharacterized protein n=1 Tax=Elysia marginata TaxID=1093978 RepID=A0AAV4EXE3_9GAST|nr:hypothetical protein ElyMa_005530000 [Elysia marginata]
MATNDFAVLTVSVINTCSLCFRPQETQLELNLQTVLQAMYPNHPEFIRGVAFRSAACALPSAYNLPRFANTGATSSSASKRPGTVSTVTFEQDAAAEGRGATKMDELRPYGGQGQKASGSSGGSSQRGAAAAGGTAAFIQSRVPY